MPSWDRYLYAGAVFAAVLLFSLIGISKESWSRNEPATLMEINYSVGEYLDFTRTRHFSDQSPGYFVVLRGWRALGFRSKGAQRALSAVCHALGAALLFFHLARRRRLALAAAGLFAVNAFLYLDAQYVRPYAMQLLCVIAQLGCFASLMRAPRWRSALAFGCWTVAATVVQFTSLVVLALIALYCVLDWKAVPLHARRALAAASLVLAAYVAVKGVMIYRYRFVMRSEHGWVAQPPWSTFRHFGELLLSPLFTMQGREPYYVASLLLLVALAAWGLVLIARAYGRRVGIVLWTAWAGSIVLFWAMRSIGLQEIVPRYFQYLVPMFCLAIAFAVEHVRRPMLRGLLWTAVVVPQVVTIAGYWQRHVFEDLESPLAYLAEHARVGDVVRIEPSWMRDYYPALWRETRGREWPFKDAPPRVASEERGNYWTLELVNQAQRGGAPVYAPHDDTRVWPSEFQRVYLTPPDPSG